MKNKKIKYFYINLDRDIKRKKHIESVLKKHNIQAERFSAIDGEKEYTGTNRGSRACRDTHLTLWKKIKKDEIFIIFEDDIDIVDNRFEEIISNLSDKTWSFFNFGNPTRGVNGVNVEPYFIKASKTIGQPGVNTGMWVYAVNGENINNLLDPFKDKNKNSNWIDVQLKENFDTINAYYYAKKAINHLHTGLSGEYPSIRLLYDQTSTEHTDELNINKDDKILIVGASKELEKRKLGKTIDKYDVVIRINNGGNHELLNRTNRKVLGTKTDIWVTIEPSGLKRNSPTLVKRYNKVLIGEPKQYDIFKQKYNNLVLMPPKVQQDCKKVLYNFNSFPLHQEPTTGIKILFYLIPHILQQNEKVCMGSIYNDITLVGFDGFKTGHWYGNKFIKNQDESDKYAREGLGRHNLKLEFEYIEYLKENGFIKFL
tara:strand:+ start:180 stop:1460 length:1281 start_codon:yes stop_codon:yes gene_type:complete